MADVLPDSLLESNGPLEPNGSTPNLIDEMVAETFEALQLVEPTAFLVLPRVLRRVAKQEWELPALALQVPHRKTWIISRNQLLKHVDWDELRLERNSELPEKAILIARPDDKQLESMSLAELKLKVWRRLYHARLHVEFDKLRDSGHLTAADFRQRVDQLGQVEFDEIHAVLKRESFLRHGASMADAYIEFAAVYGELKHFLPHSLATYFPSFESFERVDALLAEDVDVDGLFERTRLAGCPDPKVPRGPVTTFEELHETLSAAAHRSEHAVEAMSLIDVATATVKPTERPNLRAYMKLIRRADRAFSGGNAVGAALLQMRAAKFASPELVHEAVNGALTDIRRLVQRLQAALGFDDAAGENWYESLVGLLLLAMQGFWNADKKLLYDLQKVCVDHEREIYTVDLLGWVLSFGARPVKRALPNQREVLMSKHLRSATRRLVAAGLKGDERERLSVLLHEADESAERQMRTRLRPLTRQALTDVGFVPANVPEQVAFNKLTEELLDGVVVRGFITMGDMRDSISRSNLKLTDLSGPMEFLRGDLLLKADRQLSRALDGVYQRGDIYLRWLQQLSAASFGTEIGRFLTRFVVIPYGIAFLCFEAILHLVEKVAGDDSSLVEGVEQMKLETPRQWLELKGGTVGLLGTFLLLVIHVAPFRKLLWWGVTKLARLLWRLCLDWPVRLFRLPSVKRFLKSSPVVVLRKYLVTPLIPTLLICAGISWLNDWPPQPVQNWAIVWLAMSVILNSRVGRDVEELTAEWLHRSWNRIRVHVVVALFDLVMESFKKMLEWFERVLYAVDEWLRFKSGETSLSFGMKATLGIFWSVITFVLRFCVNLLIEPQINPIKHFPVVTVSHKLILPLGLPGGFFSKLILPLVGTQQMANTVAGTVVLLIPGMFGFLVWELQSNWRLYRANRGDNLLPVMVGSHGETFIRLMKPGFHSGTLPKLFARLRRVDRHRSGSEHSLARSRYLDQLHHVQISVQHFIERELIGLLVLCPGWTAHELKVTRLRLASNNVRVEIACPPLSSVPLMLVFEEQTGWLVVSTAALGWVRQLPAREQQILLTALMGFFRLAGVDLVREQIASTFSTTVVPYDIAEEGLIVWPDGQFKHEAIYNLNQTPLIRPSPRAVANEYALPIVNAQNLIFAQSPISWRTWAEQWDAAVTVKPPLLPDKVLWRWPVDG